MPGPATTTTTRSTRTPSSARTRELAQPLLRQRLLGARRPAGGGGRARACRADRARRLPDHRPDPAGLRPHSRGPAAARAQRDLRTHGQGAGDLIARGARGCRPRRDGAGAAAPGPRGVGAADGAAVEPAGARPPGEARCTGRRPFRHALPRSRPTAAGRPSTRCSPATSPRRKASSPRPRRSGASRRRIPALPCWSIPSSATPDGSTWPRRPPRRSATRSCRSPASPRPTCSSSAGSPARLPATRRRWCRRARHLGLPTVVVTSAAETATAIATLLVGKDERIERETPKRAGIPNGAGRSLRRTVPRAFAQRPRQRGGARCQPRRPRPRAGSQRRPRRAAAGGLARRLSKSSTLGRLKPPSGCG